MTYIWLVVGFVLLIKGADWFVDSASTIARKLSISPIVIGLTIVAFGTSAPEVVVNIIAALEGNGDMVVGNVVGSNIANITLILGLTALVSPIVVERSIANRDMIFALGSVFLLLILVGERWFGGSGESMLTRLDGLIFLLGMAFYMFYVFMKARRTRVATLDEELRLTEAREPGTASRGWASLIIVLIVGLAGIILGGELVVSSATEIAIALGMSQALVGLTIVAIGTSLPEMVTSIMAAVKGETDMAMGNLVGSGIFNILLVLGLSATVAPLAVSSVIIIDIFVMIAATILVFVMSKSSYHLNRVEGGFLFAIYIVYLVYIIMRG
ncbi:calcium/sodium antiporter [Salinicoccus kekensis]|uniref:Cation:H+ antiporter n=1 Tax=Salinicoccus kekensis TaxID=714307 RepID=A0A285UBX5_9STAP|nr:calcium/sodium antiporter [Salinicoccus kekensis]SOC37801.1 cation:H+ antiporter [Salinicoccus kekensis]